MCVLRGFLEDPGSRALQPVWKRSLCSVETVDKEKVDHLFTVLSQLFLNLKHRYTVFSQYESMSLVIANWNLLLYRNSGGYPTEGDIYSAHTRELRKLNVKEVSEMFRVETWLRGLESSSVLSKWACIDKMPARRCTLYCFLFEPLGARTLSPSFSSLCV